MPANPSHAGPEGGVDRLGRVASLALAALLSAAAPASADALDKYRIKCSASELSAVHAAVAKAAELAEEGELSAAAHGVQRRRTVQ